jgi:CDP-diacylglycerol--serine O-phosphatidyltransferase
MLKHFLNPPNWFTSASIFCGFYAMLLATGAGDNPAVYYKAGLMIIFAGVFDMLDGGVARITGRGSEFGMQLDSLADVLSFGVAPALLVYSWGLAPLGGLGMAAAFFFVLCAAFRLARFNCDTDGTKTLMSAGMTTTMAGGTLASMVMVHAAMGHMVVAHPVNVLWFTLTASVLMVSNVPFPGLKSLRLSRIGIASLAMAIGTATTLALLNRNIAFWFFTIAVVHMVSGPVVAAWSIRRRRRVASHGFEFDIDESDDFSNEV